MAHIERIVVRAAGGLAGTGLLLLLLGRLHQGAWLHQAGLALLAASVVTAFLLPLAAAGHRLLTDGAASTGPGRRISLRWALPVLILALAGLGTCVSRFLAEDRCLDSGGRYDRGREKCVRGAE